MPYLLLAAAILVAVLYWELVIAEGAHLGTGVVVWLYDLTAGRYDRIKQFDLAVENGTLGLPLAAELAAVDAPLVLDAACGTGRVAWALLRQPAFDGTLVNLDLSAGMLRQGRPQGGAWPGRVRWLRSPADALPFDTDAFDAVTCLEALEFMPDARAVLAECVRVLRPGGLLLTTNRIGRDAWLMPGKTFPRPAFERLLAQLPLYNIQIEPWQVEYDLVWARKESREIS
ncbi:MAG: class I SAM-dependent methyltransferase [Anaerolineales bacterium]